MQGLLQHQLLAAAQQAASKGSSFASRAAGSTAALRHTPGTKHQLATKQGLSHKARVFTAAAATEAPLAPVVATAPSV